MDVVDAARRLSKLLWPIACLAALGGCAKDEIEVKPFDTKTSEYIARQRKPEPPGSGRGLSNQARDIEKNLGF